METHVIGLDLSMCSTGIAYADGSTRTVRPKRAGDARLTEIRSHVAEAITMCDLAVIEDLPTHAKSAGITGMVHGVVRALLTENLVPYALIPPATLKAFATGKGSGDKTPMAIAALKRAGVEFEGDKGGDQCDAWWLRAAGLQHLGHPVVDLPAAQIARLDKVTWPEAAVA
jgi:Holliday junction resolvasome RuvABC endonuclease subunit